MVRDNPPMVANTAQDYRLVKDCIPKYPEKFCCGKFEKNINFTHFIGMGIRGDRVVYDVIVGKTMTYDRFITEEIINCPWCGYKLENLTKTNKKKR